MKIKSFKDVETYIYTSIVLPLKGLNLPELNYSSPITDELGERWTFSLERTPVTGEFRRNYQRNLAQQNRNWWLILRSGNGEPKRVIGEYNVRSHFVKLWQEPFKQAGAMPVFGKLQEALDTNTPFTKVIVQYDHPPEYTHNPYDGLLSQTRDEYPEDSDEDTSDDMPF